LACGANFGFSFAGEFVGIFLEMGGETSELFGFAKFLPTLNRNAKNSCFLTLVKKPPPLPSDFFYGKFTFSHKIFCINKARKISDFLYQNLERKCGKLFNFRIMVIQGNSLINYAYKLS
jgi:hypothetical protein